MSARPRGTAILSAFVAAVFAVTGVALLRAQATSAPAFDVASVKQNKSGGPPFSNFPLGPGDVYAPNGGYFRATNIPLVAFISFAWKLSGNQMQFLSPQLPQWVFSDRFDIQARVDGNPGKDEMRMMMRSLLADRFKLAMHSETRQAALFGLVLAKPGKTGPQLRAHEAGSACPTTSLPPAPGSAPAPLATVDGGFPVICGGIMPMPPGTRGRIRLAARGVSLGLLASTFSGGVGNVGRPVVDQTGLSGTFDFILEWAPETGDPAPRGFVPDQTGPPLAEALKEQLGLKLDAQKGPVEALVVDHIERPSEN